MGNFLLAIINLNSPWKSFFKSILLRVMLSSVFENFRKSLRRNFVYGNFKRPLFYNLFSKTDRNWEKNEILCVNQVNEFIKTFTLIGKIRIYKIRFERVFKQRIYIGFVFNLFGCVKGIVDGITIIYM